MFRKATADNGVPARKVHSSLTQLQQLSSQGGQIIIYHDVALASSGKPELTTIAAWKSFRLKREVVDTLGPKAHHFRPVSVPFTGIGFCFWKLSTA